jgi:NitT/TauT family transport system ATP-binding protein
MTAPVAALVGVGLRFATGVQALNGVSLTLQPGERVALLGPSGCGKSSVLRVLAGLLAPTSGQVLPPQPPPLGCVFQQATLLPWATVLDNVALPLRLQGRSASQAQAQARPLIERVGLAGFAAALPHELSGGMQMRAALARALVTDPALLLLDEPFGALDEITREQLGRELLAWCAARPALAVLLVTHSVFEAVALADRVLVMSPRPGRIVATLDVASTRLAHPSGAWPQQDAYFALVRQVQAALAQAMEPAA